MGGGLSIAQADQNHYFNIHTLRAKNSDLMLVGVRCYTSYVKIYLATRINPGILYNLLFDNPYRTLKTIFYFKIRKIKHDVDIKIKYDNI